MEKSSALSRRGFLGLAAGGMAGAVAGLGGCGSSTGTSGRSTAGRNKWRQLAGAKITFISENTSPTSAIAANLSPFRDLTGIDVSIEQLELSSMAQRVALDFGSHGGEYHVIYADPNQVLAPLNHGFVELHKFIDDPSLPSVPRGIGDFVPVQLHAAGYFQKRLLALPYDCPTIIWCYRKDLFDKYRTRMRRDLGYDPTPSVTKTWEQYFQIARWFDDHQNDVPYGDGHMAKQYDSLMCDFSTVLWAYGGDYFHHGQHIGAWGAVDPGPCTLGRPEAIRAAAFYQRLVAKANPGSTSWDWNDLAEAFGNGQCAMCPEFHEDAAGWETGPLKGKVGFSPLPRGPVRSANIYGGTGLGVSRYASEEQQRAAWLFILWATSPQAQVLDLESSVGGGTPTRTSVYQQPNVVRNMHPPSKMPNLLAYHAVSEAWKPQNVGLRPKIPSWNQVDTVIYTELSQMLTSGKSPEAAMTDAAREIDQATKGQASAI